MRIDLHTHSTASDGTVSPAQVVSLGRDAGLDVVALTDHDTVAGVPSALAALPPGLTVVPGAEISCAAHDRGRRVSVHLLGYLFDPADAPLAAELARLRGDRDRRARAMVDRLRALGVELSWDDVQRIAARAPVGRPHVAAALVEAGAVRDYADAFTADWIGPGGRAYVPKHAVEPADAVRLVTAAGGVTVLAHPGGRRPVPDEVIAHAAAAGLTGLEVDHPEHDADARARLGRLANDLDLVPTGGSDFHGERKPHGLGAETTDPDAYAALVGRAAGRVPVTP